MRAADWKHPIGTVVEVTPVRGQPATFITRTRSEAWELGDGSPVVLIEGRTGGYHLDHVRVIPAERLGR